MEARPSPLCDAGSDTTRMLRGNKFARSRTHARTLPPHPPDYFFFVWVQLTVNVTDQVAANTAADGSGNVLTITGSAATSLLLIDSIQVRYVTSTFAQCLTPEVCEERVCRKSLGYAVGFSIGSLVVVLIALGVALWCCRKARRDGLKGGANEGTGLLAGDAEVPLSRRK